LSRPTLDAQQIAFNQHLWGNVQSAANTYTLNANSNPINGFKVPTTGSIVLNMTMPETMAPGWYLFLAIEQFPTSGATLEWPFWADFHWAISGNANFVAACTNRTGSAPHATNMIDAAMNTSSTTLPYSTIKSTMVNVAPGGVVTLRFNGFVESTVTWGFDVFITGWNSSLGSSRRDRRAAACGQRMTREDVSQEVDRLLQVKLAEFAKVQFGSAEEARCARNVMIQSTMQKVASTVPDEYGATSSGIVEAESPGFVKIDTKALGPLTALSAATRKPP